MICIPKALEEYYSGNVFFFKGEGEEEERVVWISNVVNGLLGGEHNDKILTSV